MIRPEPLASTAKKAAKPGVALSRRPAARPEASRAEEAKRTVEHRYASRTAREVEQALAAGPEARAEASPPPAGAGASGGGVAIERPAPAQPMNAILVLAGAPPDFTVSVNGVAVVPEGGKISVQPGLVHLEIEAPYLKKKTWLGTLHPGARLEIDASLEGESRPVSLTGIQPRHAAWVNGARVQVSENGVARASLRPGEARVITISPEGAVLTASPIVPPGSGEVELPLAFSPDGEMVPFGEGVLHIIAARDADRPAPFKYRPFWVDKVAVTADDYMACVKAGACPGEEPETGRPRTRVSAPAAARYCAWKGKRLPYSFEWDRAFSTHRRLAYYFYGSHLAPQAGHAVAAVSDKVESKTQRGPRWEWVAGYPRVAFASLSTSQLPGLSSVDDFEPHGSATLQMPLSVLFDDRDQAHEQRLNAPNDEELLDRIAKALDRVTDATKSEDQKLIRALAAPERIEAYISPLLRAPSIGFRCAR